MISIALTKGRIEKDAIKIFEVAGLGVEEIKEKGRKLVFYDTKNEDRKSVV